MCLVSAMFRKEWDILSFSSTVCETNEEPNDGKGKGVRITYQATSFPADRIPDIGKRQLMNLLLLGAFHSLLLACFSHIPISLSLQGQFFTVRVWFFVGRPPTHD